MITLSDSGLDSEVYDALNTLDGDKYIKVVARRWWPKWGEHFGISTADAGAHYDALFYGDRIYHLYDSVLRYRGEGDSNWTQESASFKPTGRTVINRPAMVTDGTVQHALVCTDDGIYTNRRASPNADWDGWVGPITAPSGKSNTQTLTSYSADRATGGATTGSTNTTEANKAFDDDTSTYHSITWAASTILRYVHPSARVIRRVTIRARNWNKSDSDFSTAKKNTPRRFRIQYYNGSTWVDVKDVKAQKGWKPGERRVYDFENSASSANWRIVWLKNNGGTKLEVAEVEFMDTTTSTSHGFDWVASPANDPTKVYAFYHNLDTNTWQLFRAVRSGDELETWTWEASDIHWTYKPQSFEVITDPNDSNRDLILFTSQVPGDVTQRFESEELRSYFYNATAIVCVAYKNSVWSDPIFVDRAPDASQRLLKNVTASVINGKIYLLAYHDNTPIQFSSEIITARGGSEEGYVATLYTSIDGRTWSKPMNLISGSMVGVAAPVANQICEWLPAWGGDIVQLSPHNAWRSVPTRIFGPDVDASVEVDLTDRLIDYGRNHSEMVQSDFSIANDDAFYESEPILSSGALVAFDHYVSADAENWFHCLTTYLDTAQRSRAQTDDTVEDIITFSTRDKMSWFTDHMAVDEPIMADGQMVGLDNFSEDSDSAGGGFAHSAIQIGEWATQDGQLYQTKAGKGLVFSTFDARLWNGTVMSGNSGSREAAETSGIAFRAIDKDNYFAVQQFTSGGANHYRIVQMKNGSLVTHYTGAWPVGTFGLVGIRFRCGLVSVFFVMLIVGQVRPVEYTHVLNYEDRTNTLYDSPSQLTPLLAEVPERGFVGVVAEVS